MFFSRRYIIVIVEILSLINVYGRQDIQLKTRNTQIDSSFNYSVDDESLYGFILKENYTNEAKCEQELGKYCQELQQVDPNLENVDSRIKEFCKDTEKRKEKCRYLEAEFKKKLEEIEKKVKPLFSNPSDVNCAEYEPKCLFLDRSSSLLSYYCIDLVDKCYKKKRQNLVYEILFRALKGTVNDTDKCKEKMKEVCPILIRGSDELVFSCLDFETTCENLKKKIDDFCKSLRTELNESELEGKCRERLEKCYFYESSCPNTGCDNIKKQCGEKNITYKPPGSDFVPVQPKPTLLEEIGLEEIYKRERNNGIIVGNPGEKKLEDILLLLNKEEKDNNKCDKALEKCGKLGFLTSEFKTLCEDNNNKDKCKSLINVTARCSDFKKKLYIKNISTYATEQDSETILWHLLPRSLTKEECIKFESECFYLEDRCFKTLRKMCKNLREACYKKAQEDVFFELSKDLLHGMLNSKSNHENLKECQKVVLENCRKLKESKEYISRCLKPKQLCLEFKEDILTLSEGLKQILEMKRDSFTKKECVELKRSCEDLEKDSNVNYQNCIELNVRCKYLEVSEELKNIFLKEEKDILRNQENCEKALKEKCDGIFKKRANLFSISCVLQKEICRTIVKETENQCHILKENIEKQKILDKENGKENETSLEEICLLWSPYCNQLMENCPKLLKEESNDTDGVCLKLKKKCSLFWEKKHLDDELTHKLKGNLSDNAKCKLALGSYCTQWKTGTNNTLKNQCNTDENKSVQDEICERLVQKIAKECPTLKINLEKAEKELQDKEKEYEDVKKEAEEAINKSGLLLSRPKESLDQQNIPSSAPNNNALMSSVLPKNFLSKLINTKTKLRLIRKAYVNIEISEVEREAFDAVERALELYLELKEKCGILQLDCGFREDCLTHKPVCEKIDNLCKLKSLEIKPHYTTIITSGTSLSSVTTVTGDEKTIERTIEGQPSTITIIRTKIIQGNSTSLCNIDTQATNTLFHTSTVTSTLTSTLTSRYTVTSTLRLTSTEKCKPTKCTTDSTKETQKGEEGGRKEGREEGREEEVKPNEGIKIKVTEMIKIMFWGVIVMGIM